ncbi:MAG: hypothetical protein AVDCRST_MAG57-3950 [uncultured Blastococcus sp.]|uniref:VOC domain-containing protein n=1 Tax=uncultured Blastococcus sp. TaxID=217144 RepID=A0A6J4JMV7_9ACTN|nr:MAG: hypothetical protein AVDCRST_MAG57-3950 [uncultured Blastococcus sp.]
MYAARFHAIGGEDALAVDEVATPEPGEGEVRIKVAAATVNRTDINARIGLYGLPDPGPEGYPIGMDAAGTIDVIGSGVTGVSAGDEVVGFSAAPQRAGAQAEYVVLPADAVAPAPRNTPLTRAATLPLNGLTALQALRALDLAPGSTVVVTGAAGGLGMMALQLVHDAGHRVVAWVRSEADTGYVRSLGADEVITDASQAAAQSADAVVDAATLTDATLGLLRDRGAYVTFRGAEPPPERGITTIAIGVRNDGPQLRELVALVEAERLRLPGAEELPLTEVATAQRRFDAGGVRARLVLVPAHRPARITRRRALLAAAGTTVSAALVACGGDADTAAQTRTGPPAGPPTRPGGTLGLGIVGLHVTDLDRSLAFYRRLGLEIPESVDTGDGAFRLRLPTGQIFFWETLEYTARYFEGYERGTGERRVSLEFGFADPASVDGMYRELTGDGTDSFLEPTSYGRTRLAGVVDPDGNQINLRFPLAS